MVTAFPVTEAVGKLEPGVYVMIARPKGAAPAERGLHAPGRRSGSSSPTSGSPAFKGKDGVHVLVRSLATRRAARQCRDPARRPQQRRAGDEVDRRRRPCRLRSRPGARRGRQRAGPDRRLDRRGLRLPRSRLERLRPHRPRREGPRRAGRGRRLRLHRARRLPLGRDGVRDGAPARRQGRRDLRPAADPRREASRRRRVPPRPGRGPGSRRTRLLAAAAPRRHARHLARQRLHRPEGRARSARRASSSRTTSRSGSR